MGADGAGDLHHDAAALDRLAVPPFGKSGLSGPDGVVNVARVTCGDNADLLARAGGEIVEILAGMGRDRMATDVMIKLRVHESLPGKSDDYCSLWWVIEPEAADDGHRFRADVADISHP